MDVYTFDAEFLSSSLISKNITIKTYRTIILSVGMYGCETWLLTLREGVFENRVLRRIFGCKWDKITGSGENYKLRCLMICTPHSILFG